MGLWLTHKSWKAVVGAVPSPPLRELFKAELGNEIKYALLKKRRGVITHAPNQNPNLTPNTRL
jgi:hypothetical protein